MMDERSRMLVAQGMLSISKLAAAEDAIREQTHQKEAVAALLDVERKEVERLKAELATAERKTQAALVEAEKAKAQLAATLDATTAQYEELRKLRARKTAA